MKPQSLVSFPHSSNHPSYLPSKIQNGRTVCVGRDLGRTWSATRSEWTIQEFVQSNTENPNAQPIAELRAFTGKKILLKSSQNLLYPLLQLVPSTSLLAKQRPNNLIRLLPFNIWLKMSRLVSQNCFLVFTENIFPIDLRITLALCTSADGSQSWNQQI